MKILAITDIHQDYEAAKAACMIENPDLVLDCGDHESIVNLFGPVPHFYIRGNHEPRVISYHDASLPLPVSVPNGDIIEFTKEKETVSFSGIDGNYGAKQSVYQVNPLCIEHLNTNKSNTIDILLLHESPLNVKTSARNYPLTLQLVNVINRLRPKLVLSGHSGIFSEHTNDQNIQFVNMEDMRKGYLVLHFDSSEIRHERKSNAKFRSF